MPASAGTFRGAILATREEVAPDARAPSSRPARWVTGNVRRYANHLLIAFALRIIAFDTGHQRSAGFACRLAPLAASRRSMWSRAHVALAANTSWTVLGKAV
jgi:hypothetical protein